MTEDDVTEGVDSSRKRLIVRLRRDLGPLFMAALEDPLTTDLNLNPDGQLWQKRMGNPRISIGTIEPWRAVSIVKTLAGLLNKEVTAEDPIIDGVLPFAGERFAGQMPPIVSSTAFSIRKPALKIFSLSSYVANSSMSQHHCDAIKAAVRQKRNIIVSGGTGAGKTTLTNSIIQEIDPGERLAILQDTAELQCAAPDAVLLFSSQHVNLTQLLIACLRMVPDRILVGEVRGPEALDLIDAWNTGHEGGVATLHANNARSALPRVVSMVSRNPFAPRDRRDIEQLVAEVVHLVVHIGKTPEGRKVQEVVEVLGYENGNFLTRNI